MITESESKVIEIIEGLKNIGLKAVDEKLANATFHVLRCLGKIGLDCVKKKLDGESLQSYGFVGGGRLPGATSEVLKGLKEIGVKAADNKLEIAKSLPVAVDAIVGLESIGVMAIEYDLSDDTVSASCSGLFEIGVKVAEIKLGVFNNPMGLIIDTSSMPEKENLFDKTRVVENLKEIADKAYKKKFDETPKLSMVYLWILGAFVMKHYPDHAIKMAENLRKSNKQVIRELFENNDIRKRAGKYIYDQYKDLEDDLKDFEDLYDNKNI